MADTLEIFGTEYTNVTGIKATDDNGNVLSYIRPQGTKSITSNGSGIDVTDYAAVNVNVAGTGYDTSDATAVSGDVVSGKIFYNASGRQTGSVTSRSSSDLTASMLTVTAPSGYYSSNATKTLSDANLVAGNIKSGTTIFGVTGTYSGGGSGIGTLLATTSLGTINTTSTQAASLNISLSVSSINNYDLLIVESSVNTTTNGRHASTVGLIFLTAGSDIGTKNGATIATAKLNTKLSSNGTATSVAGTTAYGVYPNSCTISSGTASIPMYRRYNSTSTGTINGTYTARVYGVNLYDLIGG